MLKRRNIAKLEEIVSTFEGIKKAAASSVRGSTAAAARAWYPRA
jgi:hypothetical protein